MRGRWWKEEGGEKVVGLGSKGSELGKKRVGGRFSFQKVEGGWKVEFGGKMW